MLITRWNGAYTLSRSVSRKILKTKYQNYLSSDYVEYMRVSKLYICAKFQFDIFIQSREIGLTDLQTDGPTRDPVTVLFFSF